MMQPNNKQHNFCICTLLLDATVRKNSTVSTVVSAALLEVMSTAELKKEEEMEKNAQQLFTINLV